MKTDNRVFAAFDQGAFRNTQQVFESLDPACYRGRSVLIKPNAGRIASPGKGINTHPEAVAAVVETLLDGGAARVAIGESPILGVDTMEAFQRSGIVTVARRYNIPLIDMDAEPPLEKVVPHGRILDKTRVCKAVAEFELLLSLPVAKCHMHTGVSLGIKNLKGCLYRREKVRYHQLEYREGQTFPEKTLDSAISDLATILLPDITVVDGFIGMEGLGPSGGEAVESNFAVAAAHPLGADVVAAQLMGLDPGAIVHLRLVAERLDLPLPADAYQVTPADYLNQARSFLQPPRELSIEYPDVALCDRESCSACLSTVMLFLKRFRNDMRQYLPEGEILRLAIGKGVPAGGEGPGTVFIGNCAKQAAAGGIFVAGCPPVPTRIYREITGREPPVNEPEVD